MDVARLELLPRYPRAARRERRAGPRRRRPLPAARSRSSRTCPDPKLRIGALQRRHRRAQARRDGCVLHVRLHRARRRRRRCRSPGRGWPQAVDPDDVIYLADGAIRLRVEAGACRRNAEVETIGGGRRLGRDSRQGLNIPGSTRGPGRRSPRRTSTCCGSASRSGSTWWRLSFVRSAEDVESVRRHTRLPLVAKIEKPQAVQDAEDDHPGRRHGDGRARRSRNRAADPGCPDRPEAAAADRRPSSPVPRSPPPRCSTRWSTPRVPTRAEVD